MRSCLGVSFCAGRGFRRVLNIVIFSAQRTCHQYSKRAWCLKQVTGKPPRVCVVPSHFVTGRDEYGRRLLGSFLAAAHSSSAAGDGGLRRHVVNRHMQSPYRLSCAPAWSHRGTPTRARAALRVARLVV